MFKIIFSFLFLALSAGCSYYRHYEVSDDDLIEISQDVTDELKDKSTKIIPKNSLILVGTLLHVNNLNETSAFGRIISNQIASAFHNSGYRIIGMEMPIDLFSMKKDGTLYLTDEVKTIIKPYNPAVIVGGVYAPGKNNTYVSLRMVDLFTKNILASTDVPVAMGPDARKLLHSDKLNPAMLEAKPRDSESGQAQDDSAAKDEKSPDPQSNPSQDENAAKPAADSEVPIDTLPQ